MITPMSLGLYFPRKSIPCRAQWSGWEILHPWLADLDSVEQRPLLRCHLEDYVGAQK